MSELTTKDITEYLKNAMELESSIYRQERAIESAKQSIKDKKGRNYNDMFKLCITFRIEICIK